MSSTKKLPPDNWQEALVRLTETTDKILAEVQQRFDAMDVRLERIEQDATERYVDLRKRIDRVDERIDTLNEQVLDFKRRVRTVEEEWRELRAVKIKLSPNIPIKIRLSDALCRTPPSICP